MKRFSSLLLATALTLAASQSSATTPEERSLAQTLFDQGRVLAAKGDMAAACPKFEESQRLDPAPGTLINLAACHEALGKTATAWVEFDESLSLARKPPVRPEREEIALKAMKELEPRLSRLTIFVADPDAPGLAVTLDGIAIGHAAYGTAFPVDPGGHTIAARATDKTTWTTTVTIGAERDARTVSVPKLDDAAPAMRADVAASTTMASPPIAKPTAPPDVAAPSASSARGTWGVVALGVGAVGSGVGVYFALKAHAKRVDGDGAPDAASAAPLYDDARGSLTLSRIALGVGAVGIVTGVVLLLTAPSSGTDRPREARGWQVSPVIGSGTAGMVLGGAF